MLYDMPEKFDKYVIGRYVDNKIPDELLEELKEINEEKKKLRHTDKDFYDFPR